MIAWGARDRILRLRRSSAWFRDALPDARWIDLPDCGHLPHLDDPERRGVVSAVFNIFAAFDIPLVYFSIWFFRTQHPQPVIGDGGSLDPRMLRVLLLCWAALLGVFVLLLRQRYRVEALRYRVAEMQISAGREEDER